MDETFFNNLDRDGFAVSDKVFDVDELHSLNEIASTLQPNIGRPQDNGWYDNPSLLEASKTIDILNDIDWAYYWSLTPEHHPYINETILPILSDISDTMFGSKDWGWQLTNRYIISLRRHDAPVYAHFDAPYFWPQKPDVQMVKYLPKGTLSVSFLIPLTEFTVENGATAFVPGTHKYIYDTSNGHIGDQAYSPIFFNDNYVQPEVPLGSISCFVGGSMHSIMPNKTDNVRRGLIVRAIRNDALDEMARLGLG